MRRFSFIAVLCTVAALTTAGVAYGVAGGHFVGTPACDIDGVGTSTATIECAGKIAGFGSQQSVGAVYVVITTPAGCSNPGNPDIPGQRNFVSGPVVHE